MPIRAYLYDATGTDREVSLNAEIVSGLHDRQMLWVDSDSSDEQELRDLTLLFSLHKDSLSQLLEPERRPRLDNYGTYFQLNVTAIQVNDGKYKLADLRLVLAPNMILTVHNEPIDFLDSFDRRIKGDSDLGQLNAPAFLASMLDWHITSYFRVLEELEAQADRLESQALRPRHGRDLLTDMARLRQRIAFVRRVLTPHREVYAALARPDFHLLSTSDAAAHYGLLNERLERSIEAVEHARELLVGSFDMFTTHTALRTNEVMKVLTLVSVILLPASVIISLAALLLKSPVNPAGTPGFWWMLIIILAIALITLITARRRRWI